MQPTELRYTGEWPPIDVLSEFPNWEYALDEEDIEGQDETTICPSSNQTSIDPEVVFTAGWITQSNGKRLPAMLEIDGTQIGGFTVYENGAWSWTLRRIGKPARWVAVKFEWLPVEERPPFISIGDGEIFPLRVESQLCFSADKSPHIAYVQGSA